MKESNILQNIQDIVLNKLISLVGNKSLLKNKRIGVGVSGGADSVCLLVCLCRLSKEFDFTVHALTVNHNVRSPKESEADSLFVLSLTEKLAASGYNVFCQKLDIEPGKISLYAEKNKCGTEDAARTLRYELFDFFIKKNNIEYFCIAHNKNDQLETVLMRFLQGAGSAGLSGIKSVRNNFVRPLLEVSRAQIEEYLTTLGYSWQTDSTNLDEHYLRNRIRLSLVPFLNQKFSGWDTACLKGSYKSSLDEDFFNQQIEDFKWDIQNCKNETLVTCDLEDFLSKHKALQTRIIQRGFNLAGFDSRLPFSVVMEFISNLEKKNKNFSVTIGDFELCNNEKIISIKKKKIIATESSFFAIIEEDGTYDFQFGKLCAETVNESVVLTLNGANNSVQLKGLSYPLCVRSRVLDDYVLTNSGTLKAVADVLSDWKVCTEYKSLIPVIQELSEPEQKIVAVIGSVFGYKDWILRGY